LSERETPEPGLEREQADEPAPLLGSWSRWYALVVLELAALIALFWWFTVSFR
jgi:hypothetical protein